MDIENFKPNNAPLLNSLVDMQDSPAYALRKNVLVSAELTIVTQEKELRSLRAKLAKAQPIPIQSVDEPFCWINQIYLTRNCIGGEFAFFQANPLCVPLYTSPQPTNQEGLDAEMLRYLIDNNLTLGTVEEERVGYRSTMPNAVRERWFELTGWIVNGKEGTTQREAIYAAMKASK